MAAVLPAFGKGLGEGECINCGQCAAVCPTGALTPRLAVVMSMILHEIATNAAKYGALSNESGTVALDWEVIADTGPPKLRLIWTEAGGPLVTAPVQRGFGSRLIERSLQGGLGGDAALDFAPDGLTCHIRLPLAG